MKVLMIGASGLVGTALFEDLQKKGDTVFRLSRDSKTRELPSDPAHYENMDAVVNLAGENIASGRWTATKKQKILESRVLTTKTLCQILSSLKNPPKVLINASAVGFYGDRGDELLTEDSSAGNNFLADVCQKWEAAASVLDPSKTRVVLLRTGTVLSAKGGALAKMLPAFKLGIGGMLGSGKQYFSFITLSDLCKVILFAIENQDLGGVINAVTPYPINNKEFTKTLGTLLHRPTFFKIPAFAIRLLFGEMGNELLLSSTRAYPAQLLSAGFHFDYPTIHEALQSCL